MRLPRWIGVTDDGRLFVRDFKAWWKSPGVQAQLAMLRAMKGKDRGN